MRIAHIQAWWGGPPITETQNGPEIEIESEHYARV